MRARLPFLDRGGESVTVVSFEGAGGIAAPEGLRRGETTPLPNHHDG